MFAEYNPNLNPEISSEFAVAAMRVGHSLIPSGVVLRDENCIAIDPLPDAYGPSAGEPALRLCNTFWQLQVKSVVLLNLFLYSIPVFFYFKIRLLKKTLALLIIL